MRAVLLLVTATFVLSGALAAQAVGSPAPNKVFLSSWNVPVGVDEVVDYPLLAPTGRVLLLDWFGAS